MYINTIYHTDTIDKGNNYLAKRHK